MAHPIRPESYIAMDNFYTATVYRKGAQVRTGARGGHGIPPGTCQIHPQSEFRVEHK
jgi:hypothetical protein